jgi:hypothetical protein
MGTSHRLKNPIAYFCRPPSRTESNLLCVILCQNFANVPPRIAVFQPIFSDLQAATCSAKSWSAWVDRGKDYAQFRTELTHLVHYMGVVSTDKKDNRKLGIMFSKAWSKDISNIFAKYSRWHPSRTAVSQFPVLRKCLCDFMWYYLVQI